MDNKTNIKPSESIDKVDEPIKSASKSNLESDSISKEEPVKKAQEITAMEHADNSFSEVQKGAFKVNPTLNTDKMNDKIYSKMDDTVVGESDYAEGRSEYDKVMRMTGLKSSVNRIGYDSIADMVLKAQEKSRYNKSFYTSVNDANKQLTKTQAFEELGVFDATRFDVGSNVKNLKMEMDSIQNYFNKKGIAIETLNEFQIHLLLSNGTIPGIPPLTDIEKSMISDWHKDKLFFKNTKARYTKDTLDTTGDIAKTYALEVVGDSDAYKGYSTMKKGVTTIDKTKQIAKYGGAGIVIAGHQITYAKDIKALKKEEKAIENLTKAGLNPEDFGHDATFDFKSKKLEAKKKRYNKNKKTREHAKTTHFGRYLDKKKNTLKTKLGKTAVGQAVTNRVSAVKIKITNTITTRKSARIAVKSGKIAKNTIFTPFAVLTTTKKIIALGLACFMVIICAGSVSITNFAALLPGAAFPEQDNEEPMLQKVLDDLWKYQQAYGDLMQHGTTDRVANLSIPEGWEVSSLTVNGTQDNSTSIEDYRTSAGYVFNNYTGEATCPYKCRVRVYDYVDDGKSSKLVSKYQTVTFYGYAGADGTKNGDGIGDYITVNSTDLSEASGVNTSVSTDYEYYGSRSYNWAKTGLGHSFVNSDGNNVKYNIKQMYKAIIACAVTATDNEAYNYDYFYGYCKKLFDEIMAHSSVTLTVDYKQDPTKTVHWYYVDELDPNHTPQLCVSPGYKATMRIKVRLKRTGLADVMAFDKTNTDWHKQLRNTTWDKYYNAPIKHPYILGDVSLEDYIKYEWTAFENTSTHEKTEEQEGNREEAIVRYELDDEFWAEYNIRFPGQSDKVLTPEEIDDILNQIETNYPSIKIAGTTREDFLRFSLECVGQFYYNYAGGHPITDFDDPPAGIDCSAFVSYACSRLDKPNILGKYTHYSSQTNNGVICAADFAKKGTRWNGDFSSLGPGTIIVSNSEYGSLAGSSNHVVIYLGKFKFGDDTAPRDYCVECTTCKTCDISGVQLSCPKRMQRIKSYHYKWVPKFVTK